jgi:hypothetical protein
MNMKQWWNDIKEENRRTRRKTCPSATLSTTWIDPGDNPGIMSQYYSEQLRLQMAQQLRNRKKTVMERGMRNSGMQDKKGARNEASVVRCGTERTASGRSEGSQ